MVNIIGIIGGLLFFVKVLLHIYLKSKSNNPFSILSLGGNLTRAQLFVHYYEDAPTGYEWLKKVVNVLYAVAVLCIVIFLIGVNTK